MRDGRCGPSPSTPGFPAWRADELVLAVNEITTNAVIHGQPPTTARVWHADDEIVVEVDRRRRWDLETRSPAN